MDVYKLWPDEVGGKLIEREGFEADTQRQQPWYQEGGGERASQFAVCPACDNPIQLIGLYVLPANVKRPFGRHTVNGVHGLAASDAEAREHCPYFKPRAPDKAARKKCFDGVPRKILRLLIDQFDRVVYVFERQVGISFSRNALKGMLERYRGEQGYLYTGATLRNVPWIFAYMSDATDLFMQRIAGNEDLRQAVSSHVSGAEIESDGRIRKATVKAGATPPYFDVKVSFIHHRVRKEGEDGRLVETMTMVVGNRRGRSIDEIYSQLISFDYDEFERLIRIPEGKGRRRLELVELAETVLGDLL